MRVLIAGAGIAGLTLAHGLRRAGVGCEVFERSPREGAPTGYRLTLDADGGNALEACLPSDLYERYLLASHRTPSRADVAVVIDSQCRELTTAPHIGPPNGGEMPHTAIDRATFRAILSSGLDQAVHYEASAAGFEVDEEGVRLRLADGRSIEGDVMTMRNAAVLRDQLVAAARGERPLLEAIGAYEEDMRQATYPLMELAADHDRFGGGGLRREPGVGEEVPA